jgi:tetratricopeptide (TPR) repeat protein
MVRELGNRFHVDAILEGSVGRSDGRLRVITQLVDVGTERILWSHQDDRDAHDLAHVPDDVISAISGTLKFHLTESTIPEARRRPQDQETYNLYLKALVFGDQFSANGAAESVMDFEEVIRRAPGYAPAYAGLANQLAIMPFFQTAKTQEVLARSRDAAERALALDPSSALAHAALGHSYFNSWNWTESERELQTALSLSPDLAIAHQLYGLLLSSQGRSEQAIREARLAVDLAPTSAIIAHSLADVLLHSGNFDESITVARRALELDRGFSPSYHVLIRDYTLKGMPSEADQALNELERIERDNTMQPLLRANQLAIDGKREEALRMIHQWIVSNPRASRPPMDLVVALLSAGEKDRAFQILRQGVDRHVPSMVWLKSTPELAAVRLDPRFTVAVSLMKPE